MELLGSEVDLVEPADRVIGREEEFASEEVHEGLRKHGVTIHCGVGVTRVGKDDDGDFKVELEGGETLEGQHVLVATGRKARVEDLGLETVGVEADGPIEVDDHLRVGDRDWLYAIGDVNGRSLLTHMGKYQARAAAKNILGGDVTATQDGSATSPRVIFTDPEVAAVGHTLASALETGVDATAVDVSTAGNAGASFHGRTHRAPAAS